MRHTKTIIPIVLLLLAGVGVWVWFVLQEEPAQPAPVEYVEPLPAPIPTSTVSVIGYSVEDRVIESHTFGNGDTDLLFVGGIHGGYEWNSILLAYEMIDYFHVNPEMIPENIKLHIVPAMNPDGLFEATNQEGRFTMEDIPDIDIHTAGIGRFNANGVDLNRNFDCRWAPRSTWRSITVSAGSAPFSEPEVVAVRDYIANITPIAAAFWHSRANNVYGSECGEPVAEETLTLMSTYAEAAGYGEVPVFDAYVVTGAAEDWLASIGIPAVTVELDTRTESEFDKNLAGVLATFELYK